MDPTLWTPSIAVAQLDRGRIEAETGVSRVQQKVSIMVRFCADISSLGHQVLRISVFLESRPAAVRHIFGHVFFSFVTQCINGFTFAFAFLFSDGLFYCKFQPGATD
jgi:hypothetical protein